MRTDIFWAVVWGILAAAAVLYMLLPDPIDFLAASTSPVAEIPEQTEAEKIRRLMDQV